MEIKLPFQTVTIDQQHNQHLDILIDDRGSAHVSVTVVIGTVKRVTHEETYSGSRTTSFDIDPGTYSCAIVVSAFRIGALGPTYNSKISMNGKVIAKAEGSIKSGSDSEHAYSYFTLVVQ